MNAGLIKPTAMLIWLLWIAGSVVVQKCPAVDQPDTSLSSGRKAGIDSSQRLLELQGRAKEVDTAYEGYSKEGNGKRQEKLWEAYVQAKKTHCGKYNSLKSFHFIIV